MPVQSLLAGSGAKLRADDLLGFLVMSTVPDRMIDYNAIGREWAREGLDSDLMPEPGTPLDTFGLACTAVQTKRVKGAAEVILVQRASKDGKTYQITRSVMDADNRVVEYPKAMTFDFDPDQQTLRVTRREDYDALRALERRVRDNYKDFKTQIPGSKVRTAVRDTLRLLNATNYMGKGIYLVPRDGLAKLEALQRVLMAIYGPDAYLALIPMLDTKTNRNDLSRFHADDIKGRAEELMNLIRPKLKAGGVVRSDMLANVLRQNKELKAQRDKILEVVGKETDEVEAYLETVGEQIEAFMELANGREEVAA